MFYKALAACFACSQSKLIFHQFANSPNPVITKGSLLRNSLRGYTYTHNIHDLHFPEQSGLYVYLMLNSLRGIFDMR